MHLKIKHVAVAAHFSSKLPRESQERKSKKLENDVEVNQSNLKKLQRGACTKKPFSIFRYAVFMFCDDDIYATSKAMN